MEWLVILGLGAWVWLQSRRIETLSLKLAELEDRLGLRDVAVPEPGETLAVGPAPEIEEPALLLTDIVVEDELLLDTPLPDASNDAEEAAAPATEWFGWPQPPSLAEGAAAFALAFTLLIPAVADVSAWAANGVTALVALATGAGFALSAWRRWPWLAVMTLTGAYVCFAFALGAGETGRAIALLGVSALGGAGMGWRKPRPDDSDGFGWTQVHAALPGIALVISAVLAIWTWFERGPNGVGLVQPPAALAALIVILACFSVRARAAAAGSLVVAIAALVIGFGAHLNAREGALSIAFYPLALVLAAVVVAAAAFARPEREERTLIAGAGAAGAALLVLLAAFSRADWHSASAWAPLFACAVALWGVAWMQARAGDDTTHDVWAGAGAALALLGAESAFAEMLRPMAHAGLAALFALAFLQWQWRAARYAALGAAALAVAHASGAELFRMAGDGGLTLASALAILTATTIILFGGSRVAARVSSRDPASEGLALGALLLPLVATFMALHLGRQLGWIDEFVTNALRASVLMIAGHIALPRRGREVGLITYWRAHALFAAGLSMIFVWPGVTQNPWWGAEAARIAGPAIFNAQALAFLVPAALAFYAARRTYTLTLTPARLYTLSGGALVLIWAAFEIRRAFQGAEMHTSALGVFEAACYALLVICAALSIAIVARARASKDPERPFTADMLGIMRGATGVALMFAAAMMLVLRHPWWGAQDAALTSASAVGWGAMAQLVAVVLCLWLARVLSVSRPAEPARFAAAAAAALFALSFGFCGVRWLYHRAAMDNGVTLVGLEGLAYAVWPLLFVSVAAYFTARAPGRDTERAYLYDLQAIWAAAIWPALAFAALGLWGLFNPWWGAWPARASNIGGFLTILASFGLAACLSLVAARIPYVHARKWLARGGVSVAAAHLSIAGIMLTRRLFHHEDMTSAPTPTHELWVYVGVWVAIAIAAFIVGTRRGNLGLRWFSIGLSGFSIAYAFALAFTRMSGGPQVAAILGIALTPLVVVWAVRTFKPPARLLRESDFRDVTPSARREKRHGRRYRTP
ncbi:DUF2339 domain-containing protein [Vitreimonas flagellata]|uniref:DUF2339 domain-containing protein n=1 Tax=Vitreimonas flagellata TaxID=2560861 RepID=UPI001431978C|nr:DUF2339 domain-containing protein [Vitreimonas flagellata]